MKTKMDEKQAVLILNLYNILKRKQYNLPKNKHIESTVSFQKLDYGKVTFPV